MRPPAPLQDIAPREDGSWLEPALLDGDAPLKLKLCLTGRSTIDASSSPKKWPAKLSQRYPNKPRLAENISFRIDLLASASCA
jgi:hypothetical protein